MIHDKTIRYYFSAIFNCLRMIFDSLHVLFVLFFLFFLFDSCRIKRKTFVTLDSNRSVFLSKAVKRRSRFEWASAKQKHFLPRDRRWVAFQMNITNQFRELQCSFETKKNAYCCCVCCCCCCCCCSSEITRIDRWQCWLVIARKRRILFCGDYILEWAGRLVECDFGTNDAREFNNNGLNNECGMRAWNQPSRSKRHHERQGRTILQPH